MNCEREVMEKRIRMKNNGRNIKTSFFYNTNENLGSYMELYDENKKKLI